MTIYKKIKLKNFPFTGMAEEVADVLTDKELDVLDASLDNLPTMTAEELNAFIGKEADTIAQSYGYATFDEMQSARISQEVC